MNDTLHNLLFSFPAFLTFFFFFFYPIRRMFFPFLRSLCLLILCLYPSSSYRLHVLCIWRRRDNSDQMKNSLTGYCLRNVYIGIVSWTVRRGNLFISYIHRLLFISLYALSSYSFFPKQIIVDTQSNYYSQLFDISG